MAVGGRVVVHEAELQALIDSPAGPVAAYLVDLTQRVTQEAKLRAPVGEPSHTPEGRPAGYLRSEIGWSLLEGDGLATRVESPATTSRANPFPGEPYGLHIEDPSTRPRKAPPFARDDQPYLVPALLAVFEAEG